MIQPLKVRGWKNIHSRNKMNLVCFTECTGEKITDVPKTVKDLMTLYRVNVKVMNYRIFLKELAGPNTDIRLKHVLLIGRDSIHRYANNDSAEQLELLFQQCVNYNREVYSLKSEEKNRKSANPEFDQSGSSSENTSVSQIIQSEITTHSQTIDKFGIPQTTSKRSSSPFGEVQTKRKALPFSTTSSSTFTYANIECQDNPTTQFPHKGPKSTFDLVFDDVISVETDRLKQNKEIQIPDNPMPIFVSPVPPESKPRDTFGIIKRIQNIKTQISLPNVPITVPQPCLFKQLPNAKNPHVNQKKVEKQKTEKGKHSSKDQRGKTSRSVTSKDHKYIVVKPSETFTQHQQTNHQHTLTQSKQIQQTSQTASNTSNPQRQHAQVYQHQFHNSQATTQSYGPRIHYNQPKQFQTLLNPSFQSHGHQLTPSQKTIKHFSDPLPPPPPYNQALAQRSASHTPPSSSMGCSTQTPQNRYFHLN